MRFKIILFVSLLTFGNLFAQKIKEFTKDPALFGKEIADYLEDSKRETSKIIAKEFEESWLNQAFNEQQQERIINLSNAMLKRKMLIYPHFEGYLQALIDFSKSGQPSKQFYAWHTISEQIIALTKRGRNKPFEAFMKTSSSLFSDTAIYLSPARIWKSTSADYEFLFEEIPAIRISNLNLLGITTGDTIVIQKTKGIYFPLEYRWVGEGGIVTWERANLSPGQVYCELKNYTIYLKRNEHHADSVAFYNKAFFDYSLPGKLTDKLIANANPKTTSYPRFESYDHEIIIKNLTERVDYKGGFALHGSKTLGTGSGFKKAVLTFYDKDDSLFIRAKANQFLIKQAESIVSNKTAVSIYIGEDSIYHPSTLLRLSITDKSLTLLRGDVGMDKTAFHDSYHKMELEVPLIEWNLNESRLNLKTKIGIGEKPSYFQSDFYFNDLEFNKFQGALNYNPISKIKMYAEKYDNKELNAEDLAKYFNPKLNVRAIRNLLYKLVEDGFIYYDQDIELVTVRDKVFHYVKSHAGLEDYDVLRLRSLPKNETNAVINLDNNEMTLFGINSILLSDSQSIKIYPDDGMVKVRKNRNMEFNGGVVSTLSGLNFFGKDYYFDYNSFKLDLNDVDSFRIYLPLDEYDDYGRKKYLPLTSVLEDMTGRLTIDAPDNKSGKKKLPKYPMIESLDYSYVYYDKKNALGNVYDRERFYFRCDTFTIDSLSSYDANSFSLTGTFFTAGIFPEFREELNIRPDRSLGIVHTTPDEGYPVYGGKGFYISDIDMSNNGFRGKGTVKYLPSVTSTTDITFYIDSLISNTDSFRISTNLFNGVEFPAVLAQNVFTRWLPYKDSMEVYNSSTPFYFYDQQVSMDGSVTVTPRGLIGNGVMIFDYATLQSNQFVLKANSFDTDTLSLKLKSNDPKKLGFYAPNVEAHIDMGNRTGKFISNGDHILNEFPINQYKTSMNKFDWEVDKKLMYFQSTKGLDRTYFLSVQPKQDSLRFRAEAAKFDLNNYILQPEGVPYIPVADAHIFPDSQQVIIETNAVMQQLKNSIIKVDTNDFHHEIYNTTVHIYGKKNYKGVGYYDYVNKSRKTQQLFFHDIKTDKDTLNNYFTLATGTIDTAKNFVLNQGIDYKGAVTLYGFKKYLVYDGYAKINLEHPGIKTQWFGFADEINPDSLTIRLIDPKNEHKKGLYTGMHLSSSPLYLYSTIIDAKGSKAHHDVFLSDGLLQFDDKTRILRIGDEKKITENNLTGNLTVYDDNSGIITTEGKYDFGLNYGLIKLLTNGSSVHDIENNSINFNLIMSLNFNFADDAISLMVKDMQSLTYEFPDINYDKPVFRKAIAEFLPEKKRFKVLNDILQTGVFKVPSELESTLLFTDVKFVWDTIDNTYRSTGPLGLGYIYSEPVNKYLNGYIELGKKRSGDYLNMYLEVDTFGTWYFFSYKAGTMQAYASNEAFAKAIVDVPVGKRKFRGKNKEFYQYAPSSIMRMRQFVARMRAIEEEENKNK